MTRNMPQLGVPDSDELTEVIEAYTQVTERLRDSHEKLGAEVSRLRTELASKNRELQRRSRLAALGEMAAGIAHEIRNPLGGISLYAGLLAKKLADRPEARSLAYRIGTGVDRLDGIVSDVLAFAGEIKPQRKPVPLASILTSAVELARGRLEQTGTQLTCETTGDHILSADPGLLVRAVSNLLYNASDAAGEGLVRLRGTGDEDNITIEVSDSGGGIAPEAMDRVFDPFFTTKDVGTGLGLAIVHRVADSHGGHVHVSNAPPPEGLGGARFCIVLPKAG